MIKKKQRKQGFTLIELLAVIVILGLLMAIAIPSVTRYITQSRKKTLTSTIGNYINALVNEVNDLSYTFTGTNTIYAVPIECISLERGGTNPFGEWHQANNAYWAYVLVQYDDLNSSYRYGYTFKDSAGYGLYPTTQAKLNESGKQILTGLELSRPTTGKVTNIATVDKWNGFVVDSSTDLVVLTSESEGNIGNGTSTCTLAQKGSNYEAVEEEKAESVPTLSSLILSNNFSKGTTENLKTTSDAVGENGLYTTNKTTNGQTSYFFRGNVTNNYVSFAKQTWRIVRINEDGTIRLIMQTGIDSNALNGFNSTSSSYTKMYYSNSDKAKELLKTWYQTNIIDEGLDDYVAPGFFCEEAKVKASTSHTSGSAVMIESANYESDLDCDTDGNNKALVIDTKIGLITIDEVIHAGGYFYKENNNYYLDNNQAFWTMSPAGYNLSTAYVWSVFDIGDVRSSLVNFPHTLRPVINLNATVKATGNGSNLTPYVIQPN